MSFEENDVYYNGMRVYSADDLPQNTVIEFGADSRQNVVRLQDVGGNGRVVIDLRNAVRCKVLIGTGNTVADGALNIVFPTKAGRPTAEVFVTVGHLNVFIGGASLQAPITPDRGIAIGSRNLVAPGLSIRGIDNRMFDRATGALINAEVGSQIGSRNQIGYGVRVVDGGRVGNDSVVELGSVIDQDWFGTEHVVLAGAPARVVADGIVWIPEPHYSSLDVVPVPILTIGITTYERPVTVRRALDSILSQPLPDGTEIEVLVVDDGSRSESFEELWTDLDRLPREKGLTVRGLRNPEPSGGPSAGRNAAIDVARGVHVMFLDDDCQLAEGSLAPLVTYLKTSSAQRTSLRHRRFDRSIYLPPAIRHDRLDVIDSLWTMLPPSVYRTGDVRHYRSRFPEGVHYGEDSEFVLHFSVRGDRFAALCDRDYIVVGDPVPGESAHLSQGKGGWEDFLRRIISHLARFAETLEDAGLPAYVKDRLATKCLLARSVNSYEMLRRVGDMDDLDLAAELLHLYSAIIVGNIPEVVISRFARENSLEKEMTAVVADDLEALRAARASARASG